ncbi:MAG: type II secretion system F family protein, partial [Candidatus Absconditabacteria bacterium]
MTSKFDEFLIGIMKYKDSMKFSLRSKIFFLREIGYLIKGGVSMLEAVSLIKDNSDNLVLKSICTQIYTSLKSGENLNRSLSRLPKYFNAGDVNIIKSGEASGELVEVLSYLANEYTFLYETRNKYIGAMLYPIVLFFVSILSLFVLVRFVLPSIITIVNEFNAASLPLSTKIVIGMVDFVQYSGGTILIILF